MPVSVPVSRRWLVRGVALLVVLALLAPAAVSAATYDPDDSGLEPGAIREPAEGLTVVSIQGFHFRGRGATKKPARLVAFGPRGTLRWVYDGSSVGARWFYDVDPLPGGNLLVTATNTNGTIVMALDPDTRDPVWIERLDAHDTHDVDLINGDQLLVANMRNYDPAAGVNNDRIYVYDRSEDRIVWQWRFRKHGFSRSRGGPYAGEHDDWTHVNDVDKLARGKYLVSVRNFDQVIVVDRSSGNVTMRLGADGRHGIMHEQHNPQYLESEAGRPTILVADSGNDRIVEYEKRGGEWHRTWTLGSSQSFSWPRDADRLPDGNTLIVDSLNHRVIEVTPRGKIVWEVYAPWGTYDAERVRWGDEAAAADDLPTIRDVNATGEYSVTGSAGLVPGTGDRRTFSQWVIAAAAGTPIESRARWFAQRWSHVAPWIYPAWMDGWDFVWAVVATVVLLVWGLAELLYQRHRLFRLYRRRVP